MEPKFQSSFIPRGPLATSGTATRISREGGRSVLGTVAAIVFSLAILLSAGVLGYEYYLKADISKMGGHLADAKQSLEPETIKKISDLDSRLASTGEILGNHVVLSPFFNYLQESTLKTVRFTELKYETTDKGLQLHMRGQARGYAAVALQSQIFNNSKYLKHPVFADLDLDDKGNVTFSFSATVDPSIVSYKANVESLAPAPASVTLPAVVVPAVQSPATSSKPQ